MEVTEVTHIKINSMAHSRTLAGKKNITLSKEHKVVIATCKKNRKSTQLKYEGE